MNPHELLDTALTGDPIDAFPAIRELRDLLEHAEHTHALTLRRHGATWTFIGKHLGISRQATLQRYQHWAPPTQT